MKRVFLSFYVFIVLCLLVIQFVFSPVINKLVAHHLGDERFTYEREISRGAFYMLEQDLLQFPPSQWQDRIDQLSSKFGYTIKILPISELTLEGKQIELFQKQGFAIRDEGDILYYRIDGTDLALTKGPFSPLEPQLDLLVPLIWTFMMMLVGLLVVVWTIPYWKKLKNIMAAAVAFGEGDFAVRANLSRRSSLYPLARAFNSMADRIEQLITSHKDLTNGVSHELKTPISRLRFGLEILESSRDEQERKKHLDGLQADIQELEELVDELLTFARFDREKPELSFAKYPLEGILNDLVESCGSFERNVQCQLHYHLTAGQQVQFDPKYLRRAIGNLVQNGCKHTSHLVQLIVEQQHDMCIIHVDDDGPGIAPNDRERIFKPFIRLDKSRNRESGGYGLGLAIVEKVAIWHQGRVEVSTSPLGGARFSFSWPGFAEAE